MTLEEALRQVPGWIEGQAAAPMPLPSGAHNKAFRVDTAAGRYVLRLQSANALRLGADHGREAVLQALAAAHGLAPAVVYAEPGGHCLITEYAAGAGWVPANMGDPASLERLGLLLRKLHALAPPAVAPLRLDALIRQHCERLSEAYPGERSALLALADRCDRQLRTIGSSTRPAAIVHNDLHHSNIIDGPRLALIDWEYAGVADPLFDLACVLAYYPEARKMDAMLLECTGLERAASVEMLRTATTLFRILSDLWSRVGRLDPEP